MKESLSSSAPRSGEVEEDEELEALDARCIRRARDMIVVWWVGVDGMRPSGRVCSVTQAWAELVGEWLEWLYG